MAAVPMAAVPMAAVPMAAAPIAAAPIAAAPMATVPGESPFEADMAQALDELKRRCGSFFSLKDIDWKRVSREFSKSAKKVETDSEHLALLTRLLAHLADGHARVEPAAGGKYTWDTMPWPEDWRRPTKGPGFFLCRVGKKYYVKEAWSSAAELGLAPGMEVTAIDGQPMKKWLSGTLEKLADRRSFSTQQHALFYALTRGLGGPQDSRLKLEFKDERGKRKKRTITLTRASTTPNGPAVLLDGYTSLGDSVRWTKTPEGFGYIHIRRIQDELLQELDEALGALQPTDPADPAGPGETSSRARLPGLILDFRGNSGGGCDHDAFAGRFVPRGETIQRLTNSPLGSAGPRPYGGPIVVIVDGTVVSAGETTSGMFKEDGRAYMIGESPTAGMSSQKETIPLSAGLFQLYVSVRSNKRAFNGGRGIEGIGVAPMETVPFDPEDLAAGVDTLIKRATQLLADFPRRRVPYDAREFGWE